MGELTFLANEETRQWVISGAVFFATFFALSLLRGYLWAKAGAYAARTETMVDNLVLSRLQRPLRFLIFVLAVTTALAFVPASARAHPAIVHGPRIAFILGIIWGIDRLISILFALPIAANLTGSARALVFTVMRILFFVLGGLVVLDTLGVAVTPILASLGVGSLAVALALQDTLSNFFSGVYLLVDKPVRLGDFVETEDGISGTVEKIGWRSTHVRMLANNTVVIPNSKISSARITNYDLPVQELAVLVNVGVSYNSDLSHVERVTIEVAKEVMKTVTGGVPEFEPFIRYNEFADSSVNFTTILRGKQFVDQYLIKHEFIKRLHSRYRAESIEIPFPQRVVHQA